MGKVLIWFVIIISTVVLYCLMKVKHDVNPLSSIRECIPKQGRHDDDRPHEQAV